MKENDIAVDLNALDKSGGKISRTMEDLIRFADQLVRNLSVAGRDFDSANFERASAIIKGVMNKLDAASEKLDRARVFLKEVAEKAENYLKCKYMG